MEPNGLFFYWTNYALACHPHLFNWIESCLQALTQGMDAATQTALQGMIQHADSTKAKA